MTLDPALLAAIVTALSAIAGAGVKGVWRWGREYDEVRKDRDWWKREYLLLRPVARKAVDKAEQIAGLPDGP